MTSHFSQDEPPFDRDEPLPGRDAWSEFWPHREPTQRDLDAYSEDFFSDDMCDGIMSDMSDGIRGGISRDMSGGDVSVDAERWMREAIREARLAESEGEVPIGVVIVRDGRIIARAHNQREQLQDPTAHAETIAITQASSVVGSWRLERCTLYVTLEPCAMCAGAILLARIPHVFYGATDPKAGAVDTLYRLLDDTRLNHRAHTTGGVLAEECGAMLTDFFRKQRKLGKK